MVGEINLSVHKSGDMNGQRFGDNAQIPGPKNVCAAMHIPAETVIYEADRKTAQRRGTPVSQAVIVQMRYDEAAAPIFNFIKDGATRAPNANSCAASIG